MNEKRITTPYVTLIIGFAGTGDRPEYYVKAVELPTPRGPHRILEGRPGREFVTTLGL